MNPYLLRRREKFDELRAEIAAVQDRAVMEDRDLTEVELRAVTEQGARADQLAKEIVDLTEQENRATAVASLGAQLREAESGVRRSRPVAPPLMPSAGHVEQMRAAVVSGHPARFATTEAVLPQQQNRATVTLGGDLGATTVNVTGRSPEPRRLAVAAGLPVDTVPGMTGVSYPVFGAGAADVVAEGATKPEYSAVDNDSVVPNLIAVWTDFTLQAQISVPGFEARLRARLAQLVAAREDQLLLATVNGAGIPTQAATAASMASQLLVAAGTVAASSGSDPTLAVVNPADLGAIFGAGLAATTPGELSELALQIFGMRVYPTTAQAAGTALVGAWATGSRLLVGLEPTYKVDPYTQMKKNIVTVLLEEAVNIAVDVPDAFLAVDLVV